MLPSSCTSHPSPGSSRRWWGGGGQGQDSTAYGLEQTQAGSSVQRRLYRWDSRYRIGQDGGACVGPHGQKESFSGWGGGGSENLFGNSSADRILLLPYWHFFGMNILPSLIKTNENQGLCKQRNKSGMHLRSPLSFHA